MLSVCVFLKFIAEASELLIELQRADALLNDTVRGIAIQKAIAAAPSVTHMDTAATYFVKPSDYSIKTGRTTKKFYTIEYWICRHGHKHFNCDCKSDNGK
jgi:hypothetical protein